jgi:tetratricopeptide (TPR) repeat protein/glycosyltransferase involved in cell wall biosynthesis
MPDHAHTHHHMPPPVHVLLEEAKAHIDAGRLDAAVSIYEKVAAMVPDNPDVHHTLGLVHFKAGRYNQAARHIGRSIELNPSNAVAYRSMGDALGASHQSALAIRAYEKACTLDPTNMDAQLNLGNLFHELDMYHRAEDSFESVIDQHPEHMRALNNLGKLNHDMGRLERALSFYDRCLNLYPQYADAQFNRAVLLLAMGDYRQGWQAYEWRFKRPGACNVYPHLLRTPLWQGEALKHQCLLVHCEQGMGDVLQFMRYLPMVKERGGTVMVEVHGPLAPLLKLQPYVDEVIEFDPKRPPTIAWDLHIPMLSLPRVLDAHVDDIPNAIPYIQMDSQGPDTWLHHLDKDRLNIGLVWAASDINPKRNLPIEKCGNWFQNPNMHFISLQKGDASEQIMPLQQHASPITLLGQRLFSFQDTANAMANLDLVISVDTAAAHLAGGLGKPIWVLLPFNADWRWPLDEKSCAWYPQAHIIRQSHPGNWDQVIAKVAAMLQRIAPIHTGTESAPAHSAHRFPVQQKFVKPGPELKNTGQLKTYIGLVNGENYGWGVCSKYLIEELPKLRPIHILNEADGSAFNTCLDGTLFQALTTVALEPLFEKARGTRNYGYTFFENELTEQSIENAKQYDLILAGSSWCRDRMLEKGIQNCDVLIQGIDPKRFYPIKGDKSQDRFVIFSGGKFELRKGQDLILRAVKILQNKYPDVYLVNCWYNLWPESLRQMTSSPYIAFSFSENASWIDTMQRTYQDNGLDPNRVFTMELVAQHQLRSLFKQTDIGVFPNRCEGGTNLVLMEYMACAKPVIATVASGHKDILTQENALLLRQLKEINIVNDNSALIGRWKDPSLEELVTQLEYAYHHRQSLKKIGRQAGKDMQHFTWKRCAERLSMIME